MASGSSDSLLNSANEYFDALIKSRFIEMFGTDDNPKFGSTRVGEIVSKKIERVSKKFSDDSVIRYIDIASIDKDSKRISDTTEYVVGEAPSRAQQCVENGDILLSNVRPNLKTITMVHLTGSNLVCSTGFSVLRCDSYLPEYLFVAISSDSFTDRLMLKATGSSYPAVTTKDVMNQTIPAAPIDLQNQFADFVRQVDKSKLIFQQMVSKFDELVKSRFIEIQSSSQMVNIGSIKDLVSSIKVGFVGTCEKYYTDSSGVPMIRTGNLGIDSVEFKELKYVTSEFHERNVKSQIHTGDILIARHGSNGHACLYRGPEANCLNVIIIVPNTQLSNPVYLQILINSNEVKRQVLSKLVGSTQQVLNTSDLAKINISLPSIEVQNQFADFVKQVDKSKSEILEGVKKLKI